MVSGGPEVDSSTNLSRLQVLSVGLRPSMLELGVMPRSRRRAAGRLQVDGFRLIPAEKGMSRNPGKLDLLGNKRDKQVRPVRQVRESKSSTTYAPGHHLETLSKGGGGKLNVKDFGAVMYRVGVLYLNS